jgi:hypothetical protein
VTNYITNVRSLRKGGFRKLKEINLCNRITTQPTIPSRTPPSWPNSPPRAWRKYTSRGKETLMKVAEPAHDRGKQTLGREAATLQPAAQSSLYSSPHPALRSNGRRSEHHIDLML